MTNAVRTAHEALATLLSAAFSDVDGLTLSRNPSGHAPPKARAQGEMAFYLALIDDTEPEVEGVMMGPVYDLRALPTVVVAYAGGTKDQRQQAAYEALAAINGRLVLDRTLGGAVAYAELDGANPADVPDNDWMAGGLELRVSLLFTAPTKAG